MNLKRSTKTIDDLLTVTSREELRSYRRNWHRALSLPNAQALTRHLKTLGPSQNNYRLGIIHTYTSDLLDPWLALHAEAQGINLTTYHAPYGMNMMESQPGSGLEQHAPDMVLFMLTRDDIHPDYASPATRLDPQRRDEIREQAVLRLGGLLRQFRSTVSGQMVVTMLPSLMPPTLGLYDAQAQQSEQTDWARFKIDLASAIAEQLESTLLLDLDQALAEIGRERFFDLRFWYTSRFPFSPLAANEFCSRLMTLASSATCAKAKVIVLDADNTLWGGIIGEDGLSGIRLGPDYPGNAYVDFQRRLLDFQARGFVLALCSKNNPQDLQEVLDKHPHQVLKGGHFVAQRVNWLPKHENLRSLAEELNLGLDSFVFVDDSDHECALVRQHLPQIQVVQTPKNPLDVPFCLDSLARLEILSLTQEDMKKTEMYAQEAKRRQLQEGVDQQGGGLGDYLASLDMKMSITFDTPEHVQRLTQLTQKTNQFNLTTRRYEEQQVLQFIESSEWVVASFSLCDVFGDSGLVGLLMARRLTATEVEIDTLLMSCRVIGRGAETVFLEAVLAALADRGVERVAADYLPTRKNGLVEAFYPDHRFSIGEDGRYYRDLRKEPVKPDEWPPIDVKLSVD